MRLTLRTVLAYLDDTLQPSQAREIGEKISESKEAAALVSRIRDVIRRRRIGAPELAGPGSGPDPNLVADYLENSLPPNQVVDLEKLCQSSDIHLAEVAACHKILTMVVGHTVDVADEVRERMYQLGTQASAAGATSADPLAPAMPEGMSDTGAHTRLDPLPEYLTRGNGNTRWAIAGALLLLGGAWLALVLFDSALWTPHPIASLAPDQVVVPAPPTEEPAPPVEIDIAAVAGPAADQLPPPPPPGPAVVDLPAPSPAVVLAPAVIPPPVIMDPGIAQPAPNSAPITPPEFLAELEMVSRSGDGLVISKLPLEPEWLMFDVAKSLRMEQDIACPEPFRQEFALGDDVTVTLEPGARSRRIARTSASQAALELNRGRLVITRSAASTAVIVLQIKIHKQDWFVSLDEPGTRCGIEFIPPSVVDFTQPLTPPTLLGGMGASSGQARAWIDQGEPTTLNAGVGFAPFSADLKQLLPTAASPLPAWSLPEGAPTTPAARQLAKLYEKEFLRERTVAQSISPVVRDRRAGIAELAVKTVALTDRFQDLIPGLSAENQEPRVAAAIALRQWVAQDAENNKLLHSELGNLFRAEQVQILDHLLLGVSLTDARDPLVSQNLVSLLANDEIAIRELAILNLQRITGKTHDYLAMAPSLERRAAINRWEDVLRKNGGALLPTPPQQP